MLSLRHLMVLIAVGSAPLQAQPLDLLVGSYSAPGGPGLYVLGFDPQQGRLDAAPRQQAVLGNPSWLVPGRDPQTFYAINENGPGAPDPVGRATRVTLDAQRRIQVHEQVATLSDEPTHGALSPDGRYLFVANYAGAADPGGLLAVLPLDAQGRLLPATQVASYQASAVDKARQLSSHVHGVTLTPDGHHLLVDDLGGDRVYVYGYDPAASAERPLRPASTPFVQLPPGSGPRHLVFGRDGRHAYLTLEMTGQVAVLDWDGQALTLRAVHDLFDGPVQNGAGALHLSPDGRFLYAVNRGDDNQLVAFAVAAHDGGLQRIQRRSSEGPGAREFTFSPDGRFVLVASQGGDAIVVIQRDVRSGRLGDTVQRVALHAPSWLGFLPH
jgi:6-phosphogluconolactonase